MTQRIIIEWEPYEHADPRSVQRATSRWRDRVVEMVKRPPAEVRDITVTVDRDGLHTEVHHQTWDEWR